MCFSWLTHPFRKNNFRRQKNLKIFTEVHLLMPISEKKTRVPISWPEIPQNLKFLSDYWFFDEQKTFFGAPFPENMFLETFFEMGRKNTSACKKLVKKSANLHGDRFFYAKVRKIGKPETPKKTFPKKLKTHFLDFLFFIVEFAGKKFL